MPGEKGHGQVPQASTSKWDNAVNNALENGPSRLSKGKVNPIRGGGRDDAFAPIDACRLDSVCPDFGAASGGRDMTDSGHPGGREPEPISFE